MIQYAELKCRTQYSFLRGASSSKELLAQAVQLGLKGIAITDLNGVYGLPKAYSVAKSYPHFKLISGAEVCFQGLPSLNLIAIDRAGYGLLCRILTEAHADKPKGEAFLLWDQFLKLMERKGNQSLIALSPSHGEWNWDELKNLFQDRVYSYLSRFFDGMDQKRTEVAIRLKNNFGIKMVASNDVHYHLPSRRNLQDVLTAIREGVTLENAGYRLFSNSERYIKSPHQMAKLFKDLPEALENTIEVLDRCHFSLSELKYRYPSEWIPKGETAQSYLIQLVWSGAYQRYPKGVPNQVKTQIEHELNLIDELQFADYFLTIWDIIEFAKNKGILCQGRGAAANSIVCYVLGITAIDPVRMDLLFERFLSAERGEPPDIDVDFEHERREEVIQYIYNKYGRDRAAMVSAVVTYRSRSAIREVTKVFGNELDKRSFLKLLEQPNPSEKTLLQNQIIEELIDVPRHLSIHSGGFTLSSDPVIEIVPVEPARMEGRSIIQWDKYDLDILGLLKVDVLSLGMLTALKKTMDLVGNLTLATIPAEDPKTYEMMRRADTIGTFQIESRAQMSMLPRLLPESFYDLVVEVALVRPGPIVGKMVHPYLRRKKNLETVFIPDPRLEPILKRTLGVPIFQEQVMKIAIVLAQFTPGEADQLRRAIGAWRSSGSIHEMSKKLMTGLLNNGIPQNFSEMIFSSIQGFAEYGFPESHAASFALLAYASAYLKCHYPAQFTCALLNSQPLGFYAPHTLVDDAKRHGVTVYPLDPHISDWDCKMEKGGIRLGFRYVIGVSQSEITPLLLEREKRPFSSLADFLERTRIKSSTLYRLALGDAFFCFGFKPRSALWEILAHHLLISSDTPIQLNLFSGLTLQAKSPQILFPEYDEYESISADYGTYGLSTRGHPMQAIRKIYPIGSKMTTSEAKRMPHGRVIRISGLSVVMQRPPTAKGTVFATLEDETGFLDLILYQRTFEKYKDLILEHYFLTVSGRIQKEGLAVNLIVQNVRPFLESPNSTRISRHMSEGVRG